MKKKILLTLAIVAVFTCLFALCVSAASVQYQHDNGMYFTLDTSAKTATFNQTNRTEYKEANLIIPGTFEYEGETYTVTSVQDRSIGHQSGGSANAYVEYVYIPSTVTYIGDQFVRNCDKLKKVKVDASVTSFRTSDFQSCSALEEIDFSGMTQLTSLAASMAGGNANLKTVKLPSSLKTIDSKAFQSCGGITSLVLPNGLTTIGGNSLQATKIETLVIPATVNSVSSAAFNNLSALKTIVFGNTSFEGWSTNSNTFTNNPEIIFFAGSDPTTLTNHYTRWASYSTMSYEAYLSAVENGTSIAKNTIVYGTQNNCACGYIESTDPAAFTFTSYTDELIYGKACAHCGNVNVTKSYDPMIECLGLTAPEEDLAAASIRYRINKESIAIYEQETGVKVEYGMYATIKDVLAGNDILDAEGNANGGAIKVSVPTDYVNLEIKLLGIGDDQKDTLFALGAFVKLTKDDETVEYVLVEYDEPKENDKYYFTSYNEIIGA